MHSVPVLGVPLLHLPPAGAGHGVVMVVVKLRNLARKRIVLAVLEDVRVAVAGEELLVDDGVHGVVVAGDRLDGEVVRAEAVLRLLEGVELEIIIIIISIIIIIITMIIMIIIIIIITMIIIIFITWESLVVSPESWLRLVRLTPPSVPLWRARSSSG